jgi:hypothetical protein
MTATTPRIITIALAIVAVAVPAASAVPTRDNGVQRSRLAGTSSAPAQDLRNPDSQAPASSRRRTCATRTTACRPSGRRP